MIKLIAMDLDSTVLDYSDGSPKVGRPFVDMLGAYVAGGGHAGIVSGRYLHQIPAAFLSLGHPWGRPFPDYCIYREGFVAFTKEDEIVPWKEHNEPALQAISNHIMRLSVYVQPLYESFGAAKLKVREWNLFGDFALEFAFHNPEDAAEATAMLQAFVERMGWVDGYGTHRNATLASIYYKGGGKGNTLLALSRHWGLQPHEVLAIGDSMNDRSMVDGKLGFLGCCVGNADEELKDIVRAGGGIIGEGCAWRSCMGIISKLEADGLLHL